MTLTVTPSLEMMKLESQANPFQMLNGVVKEQLNVFTTNAYTIFNNIGKKILSVRELSKYTDVHNLQQSRKFIESQDYMMNTEVVIPIPEGLKAPMIDYLQVLDETFFHVDGFLDKGLDKVEQYMSDVLSNPDKLMKINEYTVVQTIGFNTEVIETYSLKMEQMFDKKNQKQRTTFGEAFKRNKDFVDFSTSMVDLSKRYDTNRKLRKDLSKSITRLSEKAKLLQMRLEQGKLNITTKTAENLATMLHYTAREVEIYASICVLIEELSMRHNDICLALKTKYENNN